MAAQADSSAHAPHVVGYTFVERYYNLLYEAPQKVHNFYQEVSVLSRPGPDGAMISVTTKKEINDQILSFDYKSTKVQILTADSQSSYKNGVIVLVTGFLTGEDNLRRKFTQSFFLVPQPQSQEKHYFVLNDVFRFVDDDEAVVLAVNDVDKSFPVAPLTPNPESTQVPDQPVPNHKINALVGDADNVKESVHPVNNENITSSEKVIDSQDNSHSVSEGASSKTLEDGPRKSYASILAEKTPTSYVRVSAVKPVEQPRAVRPVEQPRAVRPVEQPRAVRPVEQPRAVRPVEQPRAVKPVEQPRATTKPVEQPRATAKSEESAVIGNKSSEVRGNSIFVANLPMNATDVQLREIFNNFGIIKRNGVQVRSQKQRGNCFGFVEFESPSSVQIVLQASQASPIMVGGRKVSIEEKRGNNDGVRFPSSRSGYRNENGYRSDNFRGRSNFNGVRTYGRNDHEKQGDFSGEAPSSARHDGVANQKNYYNGGGSVCSSKSR